VTTGESVNDLKTEHGFIFQKDAITLLRAIPSESINLIVTDPAYESLEKHRKIGTTTRLKKRWFEIFPNDRYTEFFQECFRVLKKGSAMYVFADQETRDLICTGYCPSTNKELINPQTGKIARPIPDAGFRYWKDLTWDKVKNGLGYHWPARKESIILAEKQIKKRKNMKIKRVRFKDMNDDFGDVIAIKRLKGKCFYPTEKPEPLIRALILSATEEGDVVLDPFCGSGVVGVASESCGRRYILGDLDTSESISRLG
jgi:site-specific DNA-methyltransferase (adenine-specific)